MAGLEHHMSSAIPTQPTMQLPRGARISVLISVILPPMALITVMWLAWGSGFRRAGSLDLRRHVSHLRPWNHRRFPQVLHPQVIRLPEMGQVHAWNQRARWPARATCTGGAPFTGSIISTVMKTTIPTHHMSVMVGESSVSSTHI